MAGHVMRNAPLLQTKLLRFTHARMSSSMRKATAPATNDAAASGGAPGHATAAGQGTFEEGMELAVFLGDIKDNTSEYTRTKVKSPVPMRYYEIPLTFTVDGTTSEFLRCNNVIVPYVPPPPPRKDGSANVSRYGSSFVYANIEKVILDTIAEAAAASGYVVRMGEERVVTTPEEWWCTINLSEENRFTWDVGGVSKLFPFARVLQASKKGVLANCIFGIKLKLSQEEDKAEDGSHLPWNHNNASPPDAGAVWKVAVKLHSAKVVDTDVEIAPPEVLRQGAANVTFESRKEDEANDALVQRMRTLGIA